ncbi:MAG TPA: hypothetical protein ENN69_01990 [Spirochaetia bacterium]|nr:hypothetical protein [Spirochaetia bacterium]
MYAVCGVILFCVAAISCLGMENQYTINSDGSGRLVFQYRISQMFNNMGGEGEEESAQEAPLPLAKEELESSLKKVKGIKVISVDRWEDESDIYLKGEIEFDSVATLNKSDLFDDMPVSLERGNGVTTFVQLLAEEKEPVDPEAMELYQGFFEGYELAFSVTAPKKIISTSLGQISADGRTVTYRIPMFEYMQNIKRQELRVSW